MKTFRVLKPEPNIKSYLCRLLLALAQIVDGLIGLLTFGFVNSCLGVKAAVLLMKARDINKP